MIYKPHKYQQAALDWIMDHERCCFFLDMGLGKTVVTLTAVQKLIDWCEITSVLVVAPKKVAENTWTSEAAKWEHLRGLRVSAITGDRESRRRAMQALADVYVIGRDNLKWFMAECNQRPPMDMLVLDELTSFKSSTSERFKAVRRMSPGMARVVGLTGTPAPNGYEDLWAETYCIDLGKRFGPYKTKYYDKYFDSVVRNNITFRRKLKKGAGEAIRAKLADICLSMQSKDYLELPERIVHDVRVAMDDKTREVYERMARDKYVAFTAKVAEEGGEVSAMNAAALISKLSQLANGAVYDDNHEAYEFHAAKVEALAEIVESAKAQGSGVLVFYQYVHDCTRIMSYFAGKLRVAKYEGPGDLERWNAGEYDMLLAHPASTAYGLNMQQGGSYIAWFGTGWNLELYEQANARLHRQGQTKPVHIYRIITTGTVDERMVQSLNAKHKSQQALMDALKYVMEQYGQGQELPEADKQPEVAEAPEDNTER